MIIASTQIVKVGYDEAARKAGELWILFYVPAYMGFVVAGFCVLYGVIAIAVCVERGAAMEILEVVLEIVLSLIG